MTKSKSLSSLEEELRSSCPGSPPTPSIRTAVRDISNSLINLTSVLGDSTDTHIKDTGETEEIKNNLEGNLLQEILEPKFDSSELSTNPDDGTEESSTPCVDLAVLEVSQTVINFTNSLGQSTDTKQVENQEMENLAVSIYREMRNERLQSILEDSESQLDESELELETSMLKGSILNITNTYLDVTAFLLDQEPGDESLGGTRPPTVIENRGPGELQEIQEEPCREEKASLLGYNFYNIFHEF